MNCRQFQHELYEYLEGSLSAGAQAAAEKHLEYCLACRERAREEQEVARSLVNGFRRATTQLKLPAAVDQRVTAVLAAERAAQSEKASASFLWRRLAWLVAWAAAAVVLLAGWLVLIGAPGRVTVPQRAHSAERVVSVQLSIITPVHTFRREGRVVIDAVTYQTNFVNQKLQTELASLN